MLSVFFTHVHLKPLRDGALENDIVIHEYTHGITGRMTGGGTGRCLQTTEAAGLGEGTLPSLSYRCCSFLSPP